MTNIDPKVLVVGCGAVGLPEPVRRELSQVGILIVDDCSRSKYNKAIVDMLTSEEMPLSLEDIDPNLRVEQRKRGKRRNKNKWDSPYGP